jgi:hypothetical protein
MGAQQWGQRKSPEQENQMEQPNLAPATADIPFMNAIEAWAIYDAIQVRSDATEKEGFVSYAALGAAPIWPFFTIRKSDIGIAYTNRDSNEALEYPFEIYSAGVRFVAPEGMQEPWTTNDVGVHNLVAHNIFSRMIAEHVGLRLKVEQDDKLIHTCTMAPSGFGPNSPSAMIMPIEAVAADTVGFNSPSNTNGQPHISGRWKFPAPIEVPRGAVLSAKLEPSDYCRNLLQAMPGPGSYDFFADAQVAKPSCSLIRVDLIGKRGVQQRNALHR